MTAHQAKDSTASGTDDRDRLRLWLHILDTAGGIERQLRSRLREQFDVTLPRFDVMAALDRFETEDTGVTMSQISTHLKVSNGNVTGVVDRLVREGLVTRTASPKDRRTAHISLTEEGKRQFAVMAEAHRHWIDELLGPLDPADIAGMERLLAKLRNQSGESKDATR